MDWLLACVHDKALHALVEKVADQSVSFGEFLSKLELLFPKLENDATIRQKLFEVPPLHREPSPQQVAQCLQDLDALLARLSPYALSEQDKHLLLVSKIPDDWWKEMRQNRAERSRTETFQGLKFALLEKALDVQNENSFCAIEQSSSPVGRQKK
jgi:hypothetical protein